MDKFDEMQNVGPEFDLDGTTGGLESRPLYAHKMAAGAVYRAELAARLERELGLAAVRERT